MDEDDTDNIVKRRRSCSRKKLIFDEDSSSENEFHSDIPKKCGLRLTRSNKTKIIDSDDDNDKIESSDGKTKDRRKYEKKCRKRRKTKNTSKLVENYEVSSEEDQLKTPTEVYLQENGTNTRSSARLRKKIELKGTLRLPGRKEMTSNTQSSLSSPEKFDICRRKILKPYVQVNNFFKERSTYNADRLDPFASEGEEDFVVADDDVEESEPDESADETPKKRPRVKLKKRRKKHKVSSSSSADEESSDESHARIIGNKNLRIEDSESSGESSDIELNVSIKKERNESLILRSDSDDDENGKKSEGEVKLLPRRRNMNKEKLQKAAAGYKKIREIATSKLPLDRRRFLEREIENEVSSDIEEQLDDDIQIFGINDQENDDELAFRDSDKEFIVYSSESETEERHNQVEVEFKICLENLRHSSSHFHGAALKDKDNSPICETKMVEDRSKYRRIKLEYDSDDDINDNHVKELFKNLRKLPCDIAVIQRLLQENKGLVNRTDNHMKCPLHIASVIGNDDAVSVLLDNGADVNAVDENKLPSIAFAAYWKHPTVLKLLLRKTNLPMMHRLVHANLNGMSLLHLVLLDRDLIDSEDIETRQIECLRVIKGCSSIMYSSLLEKADKKQRKPILIAIAEGLSKCVKELLDDNDQLKHYRTELEGTVLHYAVMHSVDWNKDSKSSTIHLLTSHFEDMVNIPDKNGFTPLMYAAEIGDAECMKDLIDHGAVVDLQDNHGTSALHLAAAIGSTECVKLLLSHGHPVDILDDCGWPPLLYANFLSCESCVIELMKAKPKQLFVLSSLLKDCDEKQKEKNMQVIKQTILSLANQDSYFQIFNEFIRENPTLLDEFNFGIFSTTWKAILDFDNKQKWFRRRIQKLRNPHMSCCTLTVRRERVLESAMSYLEGFSNIDIQHLGVEFHDEPGMCTGPKREFLACLCNQIIQPEMKLFTRIDDQQYSPTPLSFFADVLWNRSNFTATPMGSNTTTSPIKAKDSIIHAVVRRDHMPQNLITREKMMSIKVELNEKLRAMTFIGKFVAACIADGWYINLQLSKPFIKQILGETLNHPDDLQSVDQSLYNGAVKSTLEGSVEGLELPNSISCSNPWLDSCVEEIMLNKAESVLTDTNKREFALSVSKFKLSDSIDREVKAFKRGFFEEISSDLISIFTAGEFSLLMNGIQNISVDDWKENTEYAGWSCSDSEIIWFWRTVESLKQEEKALLLKFSTGSPCVPIGGFKELEGLGGKKRFEISKKPEESNTIPTAATCFNILRLSTFTSEKELREKVLIALRHGSEGFAFN